MYGKVIDYTRLNKLVVADTGQRIDSDSVHESIALYETSFTEK